LGKNIKCNDFLVLIGINQIYYFLLIKTNLSLKITAKNMNSSIFLTKYNYLKELVVFFILGLLSTSIFLKNIVNLNISLKFENLKNYFFRFFPKKIYALERNNALYLMRIKDYS